MSTEIGSGHVSLSTTTGSRVMEPILIKSEKKTTSSKNPKAVFIYILYLVNLTCRNRLDIVKRNIMFKVQDTTWPTEFK